MRKLPLASLFGLLATLSASLSAAEEPLGARGDTFDREAIREFIDKDGRTMRAQIQAVSLEEVSIRREDGENFRVPLDTFTPADREFIERWRLADILNSDDRFELDVSRFTEETERLATEIAEVNSTQMGYLVTLRNRSPVALRDLKVEYKVFKNMSVGALGEDSGHLISKTGSELIGILAPRQSYEVRSATLAMAESRLQPGLIYLDGSDERQSDSLEGIWIRLVKDGEVLAQFSRPTRLLDEAEW